ncbi:hypothetical protein [Caldisericum exile]|uniref:Uncharacterized protein n=1 Tax=Caldisericum exile (strain DSM 21853 / NBRC 104410 / AZM16c01) TaxID=511051 RepID=A0A7U6GFY3_CALEA|nr:hypothetical protein [Caldisericum exile]BAL81688.1 hypothetical protein CSE_15620 [Caldisericum exile AZM16c01]
MEKSNSTDSNPFRDLILLLEVSVYLHDIGKLSRYFISSKAKGIKGLDYHGQILYIDFALNRVPDNLLRFLNSEVYKILQIDPQSAPFEIDFSLIHMICAHHGCNRCLRNPPCKLKDKIEDYKIMELLKTLDHMDASNPLDSGKQGYKEVFIDRFFENPKKVEIEKLDSLRIEFYEKLDSALLEEGFGSKNFNIKNFRRKVLEYSKEPFLKALSETRLFANDITLFDHSLATATLFKMYLSAYFNFHISLPKTFSEVNYVFIKSYSANPSLIEEDLAFSNVIIKNSNYIIFPFPNLLSKKIKNILKELIGDFDVIKDPYDLFPQYKEYLLSLKVKNIEEIKEGYTYKKAIEDVKRVIYFALLKEKENLAQKHKSFTRHIRNVSNGITKDRINFVKFLKKLVELKRLKKHLDAEPSIENIRSFLKVCSSNEIEPQIEEYFDLITSPIRPPSPIEMSKMFLKYYRKTHSYKKVLNRFVIIRPLTLGRLIAFNRLIQDKQTATH